jgi:hypothetical protein
MNVKWSPAAIDALYPNPVRMNDLSAWDRLHDGYEIGMPIPAPESLREGYELPCQ